MSELSQRQTYYSCPLVVSLVMFMCVYGVEQVKICEKTKLLDETQNLIQMITMLKYYPEKNNGKWNHNICLNASLSECVNSSGLDIKNKMLGDKMGPKGSIYSIKLWLI